MMTNSLEQAIGETNRRRAIQKAYNDAHGITPQTIQKRIHDIAGDIQKMRAKAVRTLTDIDAAAAKGDVRALIKEKRTQMHDAADDLDFETAALLRDEIRELEKQEKHPKADA
jgi:excinuclease ABC subunit B